MADKDVQITLSMALDQFNRSMEEAQTKFKGLGDTASANALRIETAFKNVESIGKKMSLAFTLPVAAVAALGNETVKSTDRAMSALNSLLGGSSAKVAAVVGIADERMKKSTFGKAELIDASARLLNFGETVDTLPRKLQMLTDISKGSGVELTELVSIFDKIKAKGQVNGEVVTQFAEKNINVVGELAKMYGISCENVEAKIKKMADDGQISFEALSTALGRMTDEGGVYYKKAEDAVNGYGGAQTKAMNDAKEAAASFINAVKPILVAFYHAISTVAEAFSNLSDTSKGLIGTVALILAAVGPALVIFAKCAQGVREIQTAFTMASIAMKAFSGFASTFSLGPIVAAAAIAITALASLYYMFRKTITDVSIDLEGLLSDEVARKYDKYLRKMNERTQTAFMGMKTELIVNGDIDTSNIQVKAQEAKERIVGQVADLKAQIDEMIPRNGGLNNLMRSDNTSEDALRAQKFQKQIDELVSAREAIEEVGAAGLAEIQTAVSKGKENTSAVPNLLPSTSSMNEEENKIKTFAENVKKYLVTAGKSQTEILKAQYDEDIQNAEKALNNRKIGQDEYNDYVKKRREETNEKIAAAEAKQAESRNNVWSKAGDVTASFADKVAAINSALKDKIITNNEAIAMSFTAMVTTGLGGINELAQQYNSMMQAKYDNAEKKQTKSLKKQYEADKKAINNSTMSEKQKQKALTALDEKYQNDQEKMREDFEKKKANAAYKAAVFNKAQSMFTAAINIPESASKAYNSMVGIPVVGPILAPIAAAAAVAFSTAKLAMIAATPIPKAATGTMLMSGAQHVIAGEAGQEAIIPLGNNPNTQRGMSLFAEQLVPALMQRAQTMANATQSAVAGAAQGLASGQLQVDLYLNGLNLGKGITQLGDQGYYRVPARIVV